MREFAERIDELNHLAESSGGFVWRFAGDFDGRCFSPPFNDPLLFFNMSVWESVDALRAFIFSSSHAELMRRRAEWVRPVGGASLALWWLAADAEPTIDEGIRRLTYLRTHGPSPDAFSFQSLAPAPD